MTANGFLQLAIYFLAILAVTKPLGLFMAKIFSGEPTLIGRILRPVERLIYRICRVEESQEQHWTAYTAAMLMFNLAGLLLLYAFERLQYYLPHNPQGFAGVAPDLAFNTAVSFTTNTNWQAYSGESTMSYLTQMAGACLSQLCVCGDRHRFGCGFHSWHCSAGSHHLGELLG